jgi:hypothetical protein
MKKILFVIMMVPNLIFAQTKMENQYWKFETNEMGQLTYLANKISNKWDEIPLQTDTLKGVTFYYSTNNKTRSEVFKQIQLKQLEPNTFSGQLNNVELSLRYSLQNDRLVITAKATNKGNVNFEPQRLGLNMGISNYMSKYPQWMNVYFPTMLRCEKTHFTGYLMTPSGKILAIASPDAIASYSLNYNYGYGEGDDYFYGHRIYTFNLDLINPKPLPERHPQNLTSIAPGETKTWTISFKTVNSLDNVQSALSSMTSAPAYQIKQTSYEPDETANFSIYGDPVNLTVQTPKGIKTNIPISSNRNNTYTVNYKLADGEGVYTFFAESSNGKITEAKISALKPWSWYLQRAREAALKYTQKASWNVENWYGFNSAFLAQQYFPNKFLDDKLEKRFQLVIPIMYDTANKYKPINNPTRICNHSATISILVEKYKAQLNIVELKNAMYLADWVIDNTQTPDGAYRRGKISYTSVLYAAKSIMELMAEEKLLSAKDEFWAICYNRHYQSVKRAINQLFEGMGGIETEGEHTFEDGMISCTALQFGAFALLQNTQAERTKYLDAALQYVTEHQCLTQLVVSDSRMRGATLRFWEAQYDVLLGSNFMDSPHGWSAWRIYATYYAYLLTGQEKYLVQTMNALGSCVQLIDFKTGDLRWAFVGDPYINTVQQTQYPDANPDKYNDNQYSPYDNRAIKKDTIIGEQYFGMIADKYNANSSDNDVHEIFKAMEEVALTKAFVIEESDGKFKAYNCSIKYTNSTIEVTPNEDVVNKVHFNLKRNISATVHFSQKDVSSGVKSDEMKWLME